MPLVLCGFETKTELMLDLTVYGTLVQDCLSVEEIRECVKAEYLESRQRDLHNKPVSLSQLVTPEFIIQYQRELELAEDEEEIEFSESEEGYDEYLIQEGDDFNNIVLEEFKGSIEEVENTFGTVEEAPFIPMDVTDDGLSVHESFDISTEGEEELILEDEDNEVVLETEDCELLDDFSDLTPIDAIPTGLSSIASQVGEDVDGFEGALSTYEDLNFEDYVAEEFFEDDFDDSSLAEEDDISSEFSEDLDEDEQDSDEDDEDDWSDEPEEEDTDDFVVEEDDDDWEEESAEESDFGEMTYESEDEDDFSGDDEDDWSEPEESQDTTEDFEDALDDDEDDWSEPEEPVIVSEPVVVKTARAEKPNKPSKKPKERVSKPQRVSSDDSEFDSFMANIPAPVVQKAVVETPKVPEIDRSAEPTDIRAFVRAHPHCSHAELSRYFTNKAIQKALMLGKIIKKGNTYQI